MAITQITDASLERKLDQKAVYQTSALKSTGKLWETCNLLRQIHQQLLQLIWGFIKLECQWGNNEHVTSFWHPKIQDHERELLT